MKTTTNYKLKKPEGTDVVNIDDLNANADRIDEELDKRALKTEIPTSLPANGGNAATVGGKQPSDFALNAGEISFGNNSNNIVTSDFITLLTNLGTFNSFIWTARGTWAYASNQVIADTGCGNIHLAGSVVEKVGTSSNYTIRIITPTTSSNGTVNTEFIYVNNGSSYAPGWRKVWNDKNDGAGSGLDADYFRGKSPSDFETPAGAQGKANTAESNAKAYTDSGLAGKVDKVAGKGLSSTDVTQAEKNAWNGKQDALVFTPANKSGEYFTGDVTIDSQRQLSAYAWGQFSSNVCGWCMLGNNCYLEKGTSKYRYKNTHPSLGARGIVFIPGSNPQYFDMGGVATTADAEFTPNLKSMWHSGNDGEKSGLDADTLDGLHLSDIRGGKGAPGNDLNNALTSGIYWYDTNTTNKPGHNYGSVLVVVSAGDTHNNSNNWIWQIAMNTDFNNIDIRQKINNSNWTSWYKVWTSNCVGSGSGLDADTIDGKHASDFPTKNTDEDLSGRKAFTGGGTSWTDAGAQGSLEARGQGTSNPAFMCFHRPGAFASYFGLDTDNQWKVGGWSAGNVKYNLWHNGYNTGNTANADALAGQLKSARSEPNVTSNGPGNYYGIFNLPLDTGDRDMQLGWYYGTSDYPMLKVRTHSDQGTWNAWRDIMCSYRSTAEKLQNTHLPSGFYTNSGDGLLKPDGTKAIDGWWHVQVMHHFDENGFGTQVAYPLSLGSGIPSNPMYRWSAGDTWSEWVSIATTDSNGRLNASMIRQIKRGSVTTYQAGWANVSASFTDKNKVSFTRLFCQVHPESIDILFNDGGFQISGPYGSYSVSYEFIEYM